MNIKFKGVICVECGRRILERDLWGYQPEGNWLGLVKGFRCPACKIDHLVLFDINRRFLTVICEPSHENFMVTEAAYKDQDDKNQD